MIDRPRAIPAEGGTARGDLELYPIIPERPLDHVNSEARTSGRTILHWQQEKRPWERKRISFPGKWFPAPAESAFKGPWKWL